MRARCPHLLHLFLMHKKQKRINARRIPPRFLPRTCANSLLLRLSHTHLSGAVALQGPFSGLFVAPPIPRVAPRCVVAVAVRLCAPVVPNADRTPGLRKRLFINDPSSWGFCTMVWCIVLLNEMPIPPRAILTGVVKNLVVGYVSKSHFFALPTLLSRQIDRNRP